MAILAIVESYFENYINIIFEFIITFIISVIIVTLFLSYQIYYSMDKYNSLKFPSRRITKYQKIYQTFNLNFNSIFNYIEKWFEILKWLALTGAITFVAEKTQDSILLFVMTTTYLCLGIYFIGKLIKTTYSCMKSPALTDDLVYGELSRWGVFFRVIRLAVPIGIIVVILTIIGLIGISGLYALMHDVALEMHI